MIIDAHLHTWALLPDKYPWQPIGGYIPTKEASISILVQRMDLAGIQYGVLIQPTPYGWDNTYLINGVQLYPSRFKSVCLVDPHSEFAADQLARLVGNNCVHGLRINWNLEPSESWGQNANHTALWNGAQSLGVPICLQLTPAYLELVEHYASCFPEVRIVIDHLGRPEPAVSPTDETFIRFLQLSEYSNCYVKLSGLYYFSNQKPPYEDTWPLIAAVVESFGSQRCLWGSDYPFCTNHWPYTECLKLFQNRLNFSSEKREWILGRTAHSLWW